MILRLQLQGSYVEKRVELFKYYAEILSRRKDYSKISNNTTSGKDLNKFSDYGVRGGIDMRIADRLPEPYEIESYEMIGTSNAHGNLEEVVSTRNPDLLTEKIVAEAFFSEAFSLIKFLMTEYQQRIDLEQKGIKKSRIKERRSDLTEILQHTLRAAQIGLTHHGSSFPLYRIERVMAHDLFEDIPDNPEELIKLYQRFATVKGEEVLHGVLDLTNMYQFLLRFAVDQRKQLGTEIKLETIAQPLEVLNIKSGPEYVVRKLEAARDHVLDALKEPTVRELAALRKISAYDALKLELYGDYIGDIFYLCANGRNDNCVVEEKKLDAIDNARTLFAPTLQSRVNGLRRNRIILEANMLRYLQIEDDEEKWLTDALAYFNCKEVVQLFNNSRRLSNGNGVQLEEVYEFHKLLCYEFGHWMYHKSLHQSPLNP